MIEVSPDKSEFLYYIENEEYFLDTTGKRSIQNLYDRPFSSILDLHKNKGTIWVKVLVRNMSSDRSMMLIVNCPELNTFKVYQKDSGSPVPKEINNYVKHYVKTCLIELGPAGSITPVWVALEGGHLCDYVLRFRPLESFIYYSNVENYALGIFYGFAALIIIYVFFIFVSFKERIYLWFGLYIFNAVVFTLVLNQIGSFYIWNDQLIQIGIINASLNSFIGFWSASFLMSNYFYFSIKYLEIPRFLPTWYFKMVAGFIAYSLSVILIVFFVYPPWTVIICLLFGPYFFCTFLALYLIRKTWIAYLYLIGHTIIFGCMIILVLRSMGIMKGSIFSVYSLNLGLTIDIVVMLLSIIIKQKKLQKEKLVALKEKEVLQLKVIDTLKESEIIQQNVNKQLEVEVAQRTTDLLHKNKELEELNKKMFSLTEEVNKMNSLLDKENWDLKKNIENKIIDRIEDKVVSIEEFKKVFKDDLACERYLSSLKWSDGFMCQKCKSRSMVLIDKFTVKCKQCGLPETPTSNTLFHGAKFSLQKAFYIASLVYTNKYKFYQVKELCLDLKLSRVSLSNFSKKVNKAIEMNGKKVKWEKLILTRVPSDSFKQED